MVRSAQRTSRTGLNISRLFRRGSSHELRASFGLVAVFTSLQSSPSGDPGLLFKCLNLPGCSETAGQLGGFQATRLSFPGL